MEEFSTKKKNKRKIRCLEEFHNLNRSSLTSGALLKQNTINEKCKATKHKTVDYLPKIVLMDSNKDDHVKVTTKPIQDNTNTERVKDFIVSQLEDVFYPSCGQAEESPDQEIVFKKRIKPVDVKKIQTNKRESFPHLKCQSEKKIKTKNTSPPIRRHSSLRSSLLRKSRQKCLKPEVKNGHKSPELKNEHKSPEMKNGHKSPEIKIARRRTRKSVRFATPSPEKNKRHTFDLETSTLDKSLLPTITRNGNESNHCTYKKSPHVKKIKSVVGTVADEESDSDSHEDGAANMCMNYVNNSNCMVNQQVSNNTPKLQKLSSGKENEKLIKYSTPKLHNLSSSIIDLVTPDSEKKKDTELSSNRKKTRRSSEEINLKNDKTNDMTSKLDSTINKRKKWNKSQDCSFLDNINNISAPWTNGTFQLSPSNEDLYDEKTYDKNIASNNTSTNELILEKSFGKNPSSTSTPLLQRKTTFSKETTKVTNNEIKCTKSTSKTKMPNFARIHQRAYEKLENIKEMSERKAVRAQLLLSGRKPDSELSLPTKQLKSKKELRYSPKNIPKAVTNIPKVTANIVGKMEPSTSNPKIITLPKMNPKKIGQTAKSLIPKAINNQRNLNEKEGISRFGFKMKQNVKDTTKDEQIKAVAQKNHIISDPVAKRRNMVQNVRTNRRFELLMKMRKK